jgi:transposase
MRGSEKKQATMLTTLSPEKVVPQKHPLRKVKMLADAALSELSAELDEMYSTTGRPSTPPERLLKASLLMAFYSIRSETLFCEQLNYNLLYRWFLDMNMEEDGFVQETFSKNRERLMRHNVASKFFGKVVELARAAGLMSDEHFTVDGTLIEAWASLKSFRPKDENPEQKPPPDDKGNPSVDFHGEKRSNETHQSTTDAEARLARKGKGKEAKLAFSQHVLMENKNGLLVELQIAPATGTAERDKAIEMMTDHLPGDRRITVAGDKGYDTKAFVAQCRERNITPHVAQNINVQRRSAIDARTTRHAGYRVSQVVRKRVEEIFGWMKTVGNFRKTRYRGLDRTEMASYLVGAAYNLVRIAKLLAAT